MDVAPVPSPELPSAQSYSLPALLADVYAAPGDVFDYIKTAPVRVANWLVPLILVAIMAFVYVMVAFSQPGVLYSMQVARDKAFQKNVAAGKMTQAQADAAEKIAARILTPATLRLFSAIGAFAALATGLFLMALVLWLAVRIVHHSGVEYMKVVEVCALAGMIDLLQKTVRSILVVWKGNLLVTVSPTLFLEHPSISNRSDVWLSLLDPIDIWWLAILSLGLSKVASIHYAKAAPWVFGLWFGFRAAATVLTPK
jgi:hypothetical protein